MTAAVQAHVHVTGLVQGVFYRASCAAEAQRLGLTGWCRNLPDGRVEAVFQGPREAVEAMIAWCWRGSSQSAVTDVQVAWQPCSPLTDFAVKR